MTNDYLTPRTQQDLRETIELFLSMHSVAITEQLLTRICQRAGKFEHDITPQTIQAVMADFRREIEQHKHQHPFLYQSQCSKN